MFNNLHIRLKETLSNLGKFCNPDGYVASVSAVGTVKGDTRVALQKFPENKQIKFKFKVLKSRKMLVLHSKKFLKIKLKLKEQVMTTKSD